MNSFLFKPVHFRFEYLNGKIRVRLIFSSTDVRRHEQLVNFQVEKFKDQDTSMTLKMTTQLNRSD